MIVRRVLGRDKPEGAKKGSEETKAQLYSEIVVKANESASG